MAANGEDLQNLNSLLAATETLDNQLFDYSETSTDKYASASSKYSRNSPMVRFTGKITCR